MSFEVPKDSVFARTNKMRDEFIRQTSYMGGAATLEQLIDVLELLIELAAVTQKESATCRD